MSGDFYTLFMNFALYLKYSYTYDIMKSNKAVQFVKRWYNYEKGTKICTLLRNFLRSFVFKRFRAQFGQYQRKWLIDFRLSKSNNSLICDNSIYFRNKHKKQKQNRRAFSSGNKTRKRT